MNINEIIQSATLIVSIIGNLITLILTSTANYKIKIMDSKRRTGRTHDALMDVIDIVYTTSDIEECRNLVKERIKRYQDEMKGDKGVD